MLSACTVSTVSQSIITQIWFLFTFTFSDWYEDLRGVCRKKVAVELKLLQGPLFFVESGAPCGPRWNECLCLMSWELAALAFVLDQVKQRCNIIFDFLKSSLLPLGASVDMCKSQNSFLFCVYDWRTGEKFMFQGYLSKFGYLFSICENPRFIYLFGFFLYVKPSGKQKSGGNKNVHVGKIFFLNLVPKLVSHINKKTFLEKK